MYDIQLKLFNNVRVYGFVCVWNLTKYKSSLIGVNIEGMRITKQGLFDYDISLIGNISQSRLATFHDT